MSGISATSSRKSLLRYTKSVHKLCMENGKEDESSSDGEPAPKAYQSKTFSHKTTSARIPLESIFSNPSSPSSTSSPSVSSPSSTLSPSLSIIPPVSPISSPMGSPSYPASPSGGSPSGKKSASRRPLVRESASLHLPVRQIEQEGAPDYHPSTIGRNDTITLLDWYKAMDAEAEKEKAYRGTLRATGRSKTMRPGSKGGPTRENSNFDYFVKQVEAAEAKKGQNNNNNNNSNNKVPEQPATLNMAKSRSMPRVESRWGIFDPPNKKGTMRILDGASLIPGHQIDSNIEKQLADDESLKVFMQAWNMLDTFEEHLAVQVELAEVKEAEEKQIAKEKIPVDPSTLLVDLSFDSPNTTPTKPKEVPSDLVLLLSPDIKIPDSPKFEITPPPQAATATPATLEPAVTPSTPATPSEPTKTEPSVKSTPTPSEPTKPISEPSQPTKPEPKPTPSEPATPVAKLDDSTTQPVVTPPEPATDPHQSVASLPKPVQDVITAITTTTVPEPKEDSPAITTTQPETTASEPSPRKDVVTPRDVVPTSYRGPHYSEPLAPDFVESLLQYCASEGTSALVPRTYAERIISDAQAIFKSEPAIVDISLAERDTKVVVVGDIHGQFPDFITILRDVGVPKTGGKLTLVFNGDFVDRGPAGVEVLLCLFSMKIMAPKNVYIHRGNHELESINRKYNFAEQVISKYDDALFLHIQDTFAQLPLGCVIAKKVLVIHGGLPEDPISLNQIRLLPKLREDPTKATGGQEKIVQAILWSDPRDRRGARPSKRGAGVEFGPDITQAFLARSDLDLLVRSHEMVEEGYQLSHNGGIMTIFSASYYCGVSTNKGAFAVFTHGGDMKRPNIVQYYAQAYSARDNVLKSCVIETLEKLREMIFVNRHRLCLEFSKRDQESTGKVTKKDWCETMSSVMGLHIGWHGMLPYLAKAEGDKINFSKFLDRYKITKDDDEDEDDDDEDKRDKEEEKIKEWQKEMMGHLCMNMHAFIAPKLFDCFVELDKDNDGKLAYSEFMNMFTTLKVEIPAFNGDDNNYYDLMRRMDKDEDGTVTLKDFEESLSDYFDRVRTLHKEEWIPSALEDMRAAIQKNFDFITNPKMRLKSAFRKCRAEGGKVQRKGFVDWIERALEIEKFSAVQKLRLALYVDFNANGKISWKEFKKVFKHADYYNDIQKYLFKPPAK